MNNNKTLINHITRLTNIFHPQFYQANSDYNDTMEVILPLGKFWQFLEILLLGKLLASMNKGQGATKHPIMHRTPLPPPLWHYPSPPPTPTANTYVEQIDYSAEVGKLYIKKEMKSSLVF